MTTTNDADMSENAAHRLDLRTAALSSIRGRDLRGSDRDFWTDEEAVWDRMRVAWAGLDEAAWHLPGDAPSDAGGHFALYFAAGVGPRPLRLTHE